MAISFGGKVHGVDASESTKWKIVPLCGAKAKTTGRITNGRITCVRCLEKAGMPVPDGARRPRVLYAANSGWAWTLTSPGVYTAQIPNQDGTYREWRLERQPYSPDDGYLLLGGGWYLFGPEGVVFGEPMFTQDGDHRLPAALVAASAALSGRPRPQTAGA